MGTGLLGPGWDIVSEILTNSSNHLLLGVIHHVHHVPDKDDVTDTSNTTHYLSRNIKIYKPSAKGISKNTSSTDEKSMY